MAAPLFLVPSDPLTPRLPDEHFAREAAAARDAGLAVAVVDHDGIVRGDLRDALRRVPEADAEEAGTVRTAWYRGWMLNSSAYSRLGAALAARGLRLLTDPDDYRSAHELPGWYDTFAALTPDSVW